MSLLPAGRRRLRNRLHLADSGLSPDSWADAWATARAWCGTAGSTGENHGNRVFKLDPGTGVLAVTVPLPVARTHGLRATHARAAGGVLTRAAPVRFAHHGDELRERIAGRLGVRLTSSRSTGTAGWPSCTCAPRGPARRHPRLQP